MPPRIILINEVVVVFPVTRTSVIWRVDIDAVYLTCVEPVQELKGVVIIRFDERMMRGIAPA
jgi:hypothetical protein